MNSKLYLLLPLVAALSFGCDHNGVRQESRLGQAFAQAPNGVKTLAEKADAALRATNYLDCLTTLNQMLSQQNTLSDNQESAVRDVFGQICQAVSKHPNLDSPQLFKARSDLMQKLYGPL